MISDSSHFLNVRHSFVHSSVWSQELKLGPSNPPIWKWDVFWSDKRSSEVIFFGTRTFYLFILYCVNESFSLLDRRTAAVLWMPNKDFGIRKVFSSLSAKRWCGNKMLKYAVFNFTHVTYPYFAMMQYLLRLIKAAL